MSRPSIDETAMETARAWAKRSTCLRRAVGCVLLDVAGRVLSTGYNGVASGQVHCNLAVICEASHAADKIKHPHACAGATSPSGTNLDGCEAVHAEQNAIAFCADVAKIHACYCTTAPCVSCTKLLLNTGCRRIVFEADYPQAEAARALWVKGGRAWLKLGEPEHAPFLPVGMAVGRA